VPSALVEATRALLWVKSSADARRITEDLILAVGGAVVSAEAPNANAVPADITFGDGEPMLAAAPPGSPARALLDRYLTLFLLDARRALQLSDRTERLVEDASTDRLTGLSNRRALDRALSRLSIDDTVIMLDLDHFKRINDEFGHAAGDEVLRSFGGVLRGTARAHDVAGRFGGEEFLVILNLSNGAESFLERLRERWVTDRPRPTTFSAGVAQWRGTTEATLALADEALYQAKRDGRDRWVWAQPPDSSDAVVKEGR
jgi:diguanylate cyclase (GGDEF)-like protein